MTGQVSPLSSVAIVDTMTLHYVGLWLDFADQRGLPSFSVSDTVAGSPEVTRALQSIEQDGGHAANSLKKGFHTLSYLIRHQIQMEYCPVSTVELLSGKIRGQAILNASKEGISEQMWSRFRQEDVRRWTSNEELERIDSSVAGIFSKLDDLSLGISRTSPGQADAVMRMAEKVAGLVYVSTIDCVIYASALVAAADYIVTSDSYFRKLVNNIREPSGNERYLNARSKLTSFIKGENDEISLEIDLPKAFGLEADGTPRPNLLGTGHTGDGSRHSGDSASAV